MLAGQETAGNGQTFSVTMTLQGMALSSHAMTWTAIRPTYDSVCSYFCRDRINQFSTLLNTELDPFIFNNLRQARHETARRASVGSLPAGSSLETMALQSDTEETRFCLSLVFCYR